MRDVMKILTRALVVLALAFSAPLGLTACDQQQGEQGGGDTGGGTGGGGQ